jgi:3-hydroxybutyryl-CoA dehydrogenase
MTRDMTRVGVLGAGAMGAGIAQVAAVNGHEVVVVDEDARALERARARIADKAPTAVDRVRFAQGDVGAFAGCGLVIEAIVERLDAKRQAFATIEPVVAVECVLATNTSSLSIASIAAACQRPEKVLGVHFFNPAPVMPLVEIIPGLRTAAQPMEWVRGLVDGWGKTTVLASDTPGFIVNRVARPFYLEGLRIYDEGIADAATIDWAMREFGKFRMGPFELMDLIGLDVNFAVTCSVFQGLFYEARYRPSVTQQRLVDAGMLGRKTGRGFYDYGDGAVKPQPDTDRTNGERIFRRILVMLINEAIDAVHWRVAVPADIELAMTKGVNYPKGLLAWGQEIGLDRVLADLTALQGEYGERYRPSPLLQRMVREGAIFRP